MKKNAISARTPAAIAVSVQRSARSGSRAAGDGMNVPDDLRFSAIDAPGDAAYPIASGTFLLVYQDMCKAGMKQDKAVRVKAWLDYALSQGQDAAKELQYAPLPSAIKDKAQAKVDGLQCNGSPIKAA